MFNNPKRSTESMACSTPKDLSKASQTHIRSTTQYKRTFVFETLRTVASQYGKGESHRISNRQCSPYPNTVPEKVAACKNSNGVLACVFFFFPCFDTYHFPGPRLAPFSQLPTLCCVCALRETSLSLEWHCIRLSA